MVTLSILYDNLFVIDDGDFDIPNDISSYISTIHTMDDIKEFTDLIYPKYHLCDSEHKICLLSYIVHSMLENITCGRIPYSYVDFETLRTLQIMQDTLSYVSHISFVWHKECFEWSVDLKRSYQRLVLLNEI